MSLLAKIILAIAGLAITIGLLWYAARGQDLMPSGKKLLRCVAVGVFVIVALVVIFEETV